MEDAQHVRRNGFERPFHTLQVLSWIIFCMDTFVFSAFVLPLVDPVLTRTCIAICFSIIASVLVTATARATNCNPKDPHVGHQDDWEARFTECDGMPYCTICSVPTFARTKHCRACNKCVHVFDHHCMWLNNCIGADNYRAFAVVIVSLGIMVAMILGTCVLVFIDYILDEAVFAERKDSIPIFEDIPHELFVGMTIAMIIFNTPLFLLDSQLVIMHAFLTAHNLTTYEYIVNKTNVQFELEEAGGESKECKAEPDSGRETARAKTLPKCLDWIVFARCGRGRRRKKKIISEPEDCPEEAVSPIEPEVLGVSYSSTTLSGCHLKEANATSETHVTKLSLDYTTEASGLGIGSRSSCGD